MEELMKDYNLIDIHFHTDLSFDAFENDNGIEFNWIDFLEEEEKILDNEKKIKLIVKTDHNIFNYKRYDEDKKLLKEYQIKYLPGIELNGNSKVHWIVIFNDEDLANKIKWNIL